MMNLVARTGHYIRQGSKFGRCSKKSRHRWCRVCIYFFSNPFICSLAYLVRSSKVYNLRCSSARTFPVSQLKVQTLLLSVCWIFTEKKFGLEADMLSG
jgi:hypothetical protein